MQRSIPIIAFVMVLFLVFGCQSESEEERLERQRQSKEFSDKMDKYISGPNPEIVALLALKYKKDLALIENILDIYLTETDWLYVMGKGGISKDPEFFLLEKSEYADKVKIISDQFSIDRTIIASILIDYRVWYAAKAESSF